MDLNKAVVAYKSIRKSFEAFLMVGEALEEINNLQNYKVEVGLSADEALEVLRDVNKKVKKAKESLSVEIQKALSVNLEAEDSLKEAKRSSKLVVQGANDKATLIVADARTWIADAKKKVADEKSVVRVLINGLHQEKEAVSRQLVQLKEELAKLKRRLG